METCLAIMHEHAGQGRRRQDLAAVEGEGDRDAPPPARGRAHVHGRRLQLRRAYRRRRGGLFRRAARHLRCHRARPHRPASRGSPPATCRASTASWSRPCRCRATSSRRRPASTRPASCSSPGSTGCRTISSWWAGRKARARCIHLAELFRLADKARVLHDPELAAARMTKLLAVHGSGVSAPRRSPSRADEAGQHKSGGNMHRTHHA